MAHSPAHRARPVSRIVRLLLLVLAALLLIVALAWAWLWHSDGGRDFVLAQARTALADTALRWQRVDGTLAGGLQVRGLVLRVDGLRIEVAQARLALSSTAIWHGVVRIEPLQLRGVQVTMSPSSSAVASEPLAWPSYWPALPLPLTIELPKLAVRDLRIQRDDAEPQKITAIDGGLRR